MPLPRRKGNVRGSANPSGFNRKQVKAIKKIAQASGELKHLDVTFTSAGLVSSGSLSDKTNLAIPQGDGEGQRVGDQLDVKDMHIKAQINSGTANGSVRMFVYQHLEDTDPSVGNLLPNDFWPTIQTSLQKYKILYDRTINLDSDGKSNHLFDAKIKKFGVSKISYDTGASTVTGPGEISINFSTNNATASQVTVDCNCRVRYYDN